MHVTNVKPLESFCQSNSFLKTKVALITHYDTVYQNWIEVFFLVLEYLQLISQALVLQPSSYEDPRTENPFLFNWVLYFFKLINPSYLLSYSQDDQLTSVILVIVFCCMILKYILFGYIVCVAFWDCKKNTLLINLWKWTFRSQCRALCFLLTSFWVRTIVSASSQEFNWLGMSSLASITIGSVLIGLEYSLSFLIETQFCYVLPTKNFLSTKDYWTQTTTLFQKFILQILQISFMHLDSVTMTWIFAILNIVFTIIRSFRFYTVLPLYNLKALLYQGRLLSLVIAFDLTSFFEALLSTANYDEANINFIVMIWVVLALLANKLSEEFLQKEMIKLLCTRSRSPALLVHKVSIIKQLRGIEMVPDKLTVKSDLDYLLNVMINTDTKNIFGFECKLESLTEIDKEKDFKSLLLQYLDNLAQKYPNNLFIKLHIAYLCSKNSSLYARAIRIIAELEQSISPTIKLTSSVLMYQVQKNILAEYNNGSVNLDIYTYIKNRIFLEDLRKEMLNQTELKMTICKNIIEDTSDIGQIYDCAQLLDKSKRYIQSKINLQLQAVSTSFVEPLRLYAEYSLVLNYSLQEYQRYNELYLQKSSRYEKHFKDLNLSKDNLNQNTNAFLIVSAQKTDNGRIVFCTQPLQDMCGGEKGLYLGSHVSSLFTANFQSFYTDLFRETLETGKSNLLNKILPAYLCHKDKHIIEAEFYVRIHPYVTEHLYLDMIIRPIPSGKEYILIKEDGDIEGATKTISKALKLDKALRVCPVNIRALSEELSSVNKAFNYIEKNKLVKSGLKPNEKANQAAKLASSSSLEISGNLKKGKAQELYSIYNSGGKMVELKSVGQNLEALHQDFAYHCTVSTVPYGPGFMKLITLNEATKGDNQDVETGFHTRLRTRTSPLREERIIEISEDSDEDEKNNVSLLASENVDDCKEKDSFELVVDWRRDTNANTDGNLLTSPTQGESSKRPLVTSLASKRLLSDQIPTSARPNVRVSTVITSGPQQDSEGDQVRRVERTNSYVGSNDSSSSTNDGSTNKMFRRALSTKTYPKSFNFLCFLFYGVVVFTLCGQIALKIVTDNTMNDLVVKKNILKYAENRLYRAVSLQVVSRGIGLQISGALSQNNPASAGRTVAQGIDRLKQHAVDLEDSNRKIISYLDSLDVSIRDILFDNDNRIFGSYSNSQDSSYKNVTSFQVVDEMINTVQILDGMDNPVSQQATRALNFIAINILNDFLYKETIVTSLFLDSVNKEKKYLQDVIAWSLLTPGSLALMGIMLTLIIWHQYTIETSYISAILKLDIVGVRSIFGTLRDFKKRLSNEEYFTSKQVGQFLRSLAIMQQDSQDRIFHKKSNSQIIKYSGIKARYYIHLIKALFYTALLIGVTTWSYFSKQASTETIYKRQSQLEFMNLISARVPVSYATFAELFVTNNTNYIERLSPLQAMTQEVVEVKNIQQETPQIMMNNDHNYDPEIKTLLFDNTGCSRFTDVADLEYCNTLYNQGIPTNFLSVMTVFESLMQNKLLDYNNANKSSMGQILTAAYVNIVNFIPSYDLLVADSLTMGKIIDSFLTKNISDAEHLRVLILVIFLISFVIVSLLFWYQILAKLRQVYNDFKKILQVFPSNLIQTNILLKTFLKKTSGVSL